VQATDRPGLGVGTASVNWARAPAAAETAAEAAATGEAAGVAGTAGAAIYPGGWRSRASAGLSAALGAPSACVVDLGSRGASGADNRHN